MTNNVRVMDDGYSTVGTLKAIENQLKDEITEYLYNREDILGEDTQADWDALGEIQRMDDDGQIYKLSFDPDGHFGFTITPFNHFADDPEKMIDFKELDKDEFLRSYSYLTEEEYDNTYTLKWQVKGYKTICA